MNWNWITNLNKLTKESFSNQKGHWKLFIWLILFSLLPAIWMLVRTLVITKFMEASIETYVQWEYINIVMEVVQEALIFPLFWWFGKIITKNDKDMVKIKEILLLTFFIYLIIIAVLSVFVGDLVNALSSTEGYYQKTFFVLQLWSKIPGILTMVLSVVFLNMKMYKTFAIILLVKVVTIISFDFTFSNGNVLHNGYIGIGVSSLLTEIIVFITALLLVAREFGFKRFFNFKDINFKNLTFTKQFFSNMIAAMLFSLINNLFYLFMVAKNMNIANGSSAYWISNTVIWSWILMIPTIIFNVNKSIVSTEDNLSYKSRLFLLVEFQVISLCSILLGFAIFIPLYEPLTLFLTNNNEELVKQSWKIFKNIIGFFIFYASSTSISAHFNGEGKNWLLTFQALISNILIHVPFLILWKQGIIVMGVNEIAWMFGNGLFFSWIVSVIFIAFYMEIIKNKEYLKRSQK